MRMLRTTALGFTLIEVLVAVAILGILAAVAIPAYTDYVRRGHRAEGRQALAEAIQAQERFYAANNRYSAFSTGTPNGFATTSGEDPARARYTLEGVACGGSVEAVCVEVRATPRNWTDARCGNLSLTTNGVRLPADANCWGR